MKIKIIVAAFFILVLASSSPAQINLKDSVPLLTNKGGTGSAYWVAPGILRTVEHVTQYPPIFITQAPHPFIQVDIICRDRATDSALLKADTNGPVLPEGRVTLQLHDEVLLVGWPAGVYKESRATVHGYVLSMPYSDGRYVGPLYILKPDSPMGPGSSGGVVLKNGVAVATITGSMDILMSAIPIPDSKCQVP